MYQVLHAVCVCVCVCISSWVKWLIELLGSIVAFHNDARRQWPGNSGAGEHQVSIGEDEDNKQPVRANEAYPAPDRQLETELPAACSQLQCYLWRHWAAPTEQTILLWDGVQFLIHVSRMSHQGPQRVPKSTLRNWANEPAKRFK